MYNIISGACEILRYFLLLCIVVIGFVFHPLHPSAGALSLLLAVAAAAAACPNPYHLLTLLLVIY